MVEVSFCGVGGTLWLVVLVSSLLPVVADFVKVDRVGKYWGRLAESQYLCRLFGEAK